MCYEIFYYKNVIFYYKNVIIFYYKNVIIFYYKMLLYFIIKMLFNFIIQKTFVSIIICLSLYALYTLFCMFMHRYRLVFLLYSSAMMLTLIY
jgi:hypothetical protein